MDDDLGGQLDAFFARHNFQFYKSAYLASSNPVFVWRCYREVRRLGYPIPDWILEYFDQVGDGIANAEAPIKALKFHSNKAYALAGWTTERLSTYRNYMTLRTRFDMSYNEATEKIAADKGVDVRTIQRHISEMFPTDNNS